MKPILTVLIPSRYRFDRLVSCIDSFVNLASDKNNVEFIVKFDCDDTESYSRINEIRTDINIKFIVSDRLEGYNSLHTYANYMYKLATGSWIMFSTDDAQILTKEWDLILPNQPDEMVCLSPKENGKNSDVFPIITLESCKIFDMFCGNHAQDRWINQIYIDAGAMLDIDIEFKHYCLNDKSNEDRRINVLPDDWNETHHIRTAQTIEIIEHNG